MKRIAIVIAGTFVFSLAATATDYGQMDTFLGYTFTRFNSSSTLPFYNANGGSAQWAYNFNKWFSGVVDAGAVTSCCIGGDRTFSLVDVNRTVVNILAGPRVSLRVGRLKRLKPYAQVLFGGAYANASAPAVGVLPLPNSFPRDITTSWGFAMTAGGGLDIKVSKHVYVRPVQAEYFLNQLQSFQGFGKETWNNFRYSAGINFTYGRPQ
jgi:opacity protein-like surface antigen